MTNLVCVCILLFSQLYSQASVALVFALNGARRLIDRRWYAVNILKFLTLLLCSCVGNSVYILHYSIRHATLFMKSRLIINLSKYFCLSTFYHILMQKLLDL